MAENAKSAENRSENLKYSQKIFIVWGYYLIYFNQNYSKFTDFLPALEAVISRLGPDPICFDPFVDFVLSFSGEINTFLSLGKNSVLSRYCAYDHWLCLTAPFVLLRFVFRHLEASTAVIS